MLPCHNYLPFGTTSWFSVLVLSAMSTFTNQKNKYSVPILVSLISSKRRKLLRILKSILIRSMLVTFELYNINKSWYTGFPNKVPVRLCIFKAKAKILTSGLTWFNQRKISANKYIVAYKSFVGQQMIIYSYFCDYYSYYWVLVHYLLYNSHPKF